MIDKSASREVPVRVDTSLHLGDCYRIHLFIYDGEVLFTVKYAALWFKGIVRFQECDLGRDNGRLDAFGCSFSGGLAAGGVKE